MPSALDVVISQDEKKAILIFAENIEQKTKSVEVDNGLTEDETIYIFDRYQLTVNNRPGIVDDVLENRSQWLKQAIEQEYEALASDIRHQRNKLLEESDKEFCIDRILPDSISTTAFTSRLRELAQGKMAKYRQALRDIPQQEGFPYDVKFPTKPY